MKEYEVIVLSGGSINGLAILGALSYYYERYDMNKVKTYIGTSIGSVIGLLLAINFTPKELFKDVLSSDLFSKIKHFDIFNLMNGTGLLDYNIIESSILKLMKEKNIDENITLLQMYQLLGKSLIFSTYNYDDGNVEYLSYKSHPNLRCLDAVHMSANLPLLFDKFYYEGNHYIDGGIGDNFPIQLANTPNRVLGIYIQPSDENKSDTILEYIYNLIFIPIYNSVNYKASKYENDYTLIKIKTSSTHFNFGLDAKAQIQIFVRGYKSCEFKN